MPQVHQREIQRFERTKDEVAPGGNPKKGRVGVVMWRNDPITHPPGVFEIKPCPKCRRIERAEDIEPIGVQFDVLVAWNCICGTTRCLRPTVDQFALVARAVEADKRAGRG